MSRVRFIFFQSFFFFLFSFFFVGSLMIQVLISIRGCLFILIFLSCFPMEVQIAPCIQFSPNYLYFEVILADPFFTENTEELVNSVGEGEVKEVISENGRSIIVMVLKQVCTLIYVYLGNPFFLCFVSLICKFMFPSIILTSFKIF